jgi:uncharacterized protein (DUF697 family)/uncharacterized tellurite resistance protein B-like protein
MTDQERQAIMTLVVMAAFADDRNADAERQEVRRIADSLSEDSGLNVAGIYQDVLLKRASLDAAVAALASPETKRLAYELCVGVCDADGTQGDAERSFLSDLQARLGFSAAEAAAAEVFTADAEALAAAPLAVTEPPDLPVVQASRLSAAEQDRMILNYAILNGALELLPDSLATMAIIPLQMKMVYRIGRAHGYELDRGHVKDFLATAGVGLTGQYLEEVGRKLVGGLLGALGGRMLGGLGAGATGMAFSFATTHALGQVAKRYYASGRTMSGPMLKDAFASLLAQAKGLQGGYRAQIEAQARTLDLGKISELVRAR